MRRSAHPLSAVLLVWACGDPPEPEAWSETSWEETVVGCGDGVLDAGEECDDGEANSDSEVDACRTSCVSAHCGDGVVDSSESCDDGDASAMDGCSSSCLVEGGWTCEGQPSICIASKYEFC